jgi:alpha-tubulin suppressor-like RCC1 family protein
MVDLMMWLVIAALLLAAAIQGVGYYRESVILYHIKSDTLGAVGVVQATSAQKEGYTNQPVIDEGLGNTKWSDGTTNLGKSNSDGSFSITAGNPEITKSVVYCSQNGITVVKNIDIPAFRCGTETVAGGPIVTVPPEEEDIELEPASNSYLAVFGSNDMGAIGIANTNWKAHALSPTVPALISNKVITSASAGSYHACAIADTDTYCWGSNWAGESGSDPLPTDEYEYWAPNLIDTSTGDAAGKKFVKVSAGDFFTCALDIKGKAYCWGGGYSGELGIGEFDMEEELQEKYVPVAVDMSGPLAGKQFIDISAGYAHTCAITTDGEAYCWGYNGRGALGDGTTIDSWVPVRVSGELLGKNVTRISTNSYGPQASTCAVAEGKAYCWGVTTYGQLGDGILPNWSASRSTFFRASPSPVDTTGVLSGKTVTEITVGDVHACVIADGQVYCWGAFNMLGDGSTRDRNGYYLGANSVGPTSQRIEGSFVPTQLVMQGDLAGKEVKSISAGAFTTYLIASDDKIYSWGQAHEGSIGNGTTGIYNYVAAPIDYSGVMNGKKAVSISGGGWFALIRYLP